MIKQLCAIALFAILSEVSWAEGIGVIKSLTGDVSVERDLQTHASDVAVGFSLHNFDRVTTGADGIAQIVLTAASGVGATITAKSDTSLVFEMQVDSGVKQEAIELLNGSISLEVQPLAAASEFYVRTEGALLRNRGTQFDVTTAVSGDVLVSVNEGTVQCEDANGDILFAVPQRAVEMTEGGVFRNLPVEPSHIGAFRATWAAQRVAAFRTGAQQIALGYAERFIALQPQFDAAYRALMSHRETLDRWYSEDRAAGSTGDIAASRTSLVGADLLHMRRIQFVFERVVNRITRLEHYYEHVARWQDTPQVSFARFFAEFQNQVADIAGRLDTVRYISKLYVQHGGALQLDSVPPIRTGLQTVQ